MYVCVKIIIIKSNVIYKIACDTQIECKIIKNFMNESTIDKTWCKTRNYSFQLADNKQIHSYLICFHYVYIEYCKISFYNRCYSVPIRAKSYRIVIDRKFRPSNVIKTAIVWTFVYRINTVALSTKNCAIGNVKKKSPVVIIENKTKYIFCYQTICVVCTNDVFCY